MLEVSVSVEAGINQLLGPDCPPSFPHDRYPGMQEDAAEHLNGSGGYDGEFSEPVSGSGIPLLDSGDTSANTNGAAHNADAVLSYQCICVDGFVPDPANEFRCIPRTRRFVLSREITGPNAYMLPPFPQVGLSAAANIGARAVVSAYRSRREGGLQSVGRTTDANAPQGCCRRC